MTPRPRPSRWGWSLLELLIVLTVMVGVVGIAFPRLTRPLAESEVQRAASDFRDHMIDCRQGAVIAGRPFVLSLRRGSGDYVWGDWAAVLAERDGVGTGSASIGGESDAVLANDTAASSSASGSRPGDETSEPPLVLRRQALPEGIVFEAVYWEGETPIEAWGEIEIAEGRGDGGQGDGEALSGRGESGTGDSGAMAGRGAAGAGQVEENASSAIEVGRRDHLNFLPSGRGRDCVIVFREPLTGMRAALESDAITSMTRVVRLPPVAAEAVALSGAASFEPTGATR